MNTDIEKLKYPIGKFTFKEIEGNAYSDLIDRLADLPNKLRLAVSNLDDAQLDTPYREGGWTLRQVIHHLPDSHGNAYIRFKLAFTEKVFIYHSGSYSFKKITSNEYASLFSRNLEYFQKKHGKNKWGFSLILKNFMQVLIQQIHNSSDHQLIKNYKLRAKSFENLIGVLTKIEALKVDNYKDIF